MTYIFVQPYLLPELFFGHGISEQFFGRYQSELIAVAQGEFTQASYAIKTRAIRCKAGGIDRAAVILSAPPSNGVEVLKRDSHRLEDCVARCADRIGAMRFQSSSQCCRRSTFLRRQICLHAWRWIRWTHAHEGFQIPLAALDR